MAGAAGPVLTLLQTTLNGMNFFKPVLRGIFALALFPPVFAFGDLIRIDNSSSPDAKYYLTFKTTTDEYQETVAKLQVRRANGDKVIGEFDYDQFSPTITPSSAKPSWNSTSTAFALTSYQTRGWTGTELYLKTNGEKWIHPEFPQFPETYIGHNGWTGGGKGHFVIVSWESPRKVKIDLRDRLDWMHPGPVPVIDAEVESDWVYFEVNPALGDKAIRFLRIVPKTKAEIDANENQAPM